MHLPHRRKRTCFPELVRLFGDGGVALSCRKLRQDGAKPVARQVAASLAPTVTAVRAPRLDRMACGRLADRCTAAAARHELTGHLPSAAHRCRKRGWSSTCNMIAAGRCRCLSAMDSSITVHLAKPNSLDMLALVGEVRRQAGQHNHPHQAARTLHRAREARTHTRMRSRTPRPPTPDTGRGVRRERKGW